MNEREFTETLRQTGYSEEAVNWLNGLVMEQLYEKFFENYGGKDWPANPKGFLTEALNMEHIDPFDYVGDILSPESDDGKMRLRDDDIFTVKEFRKEWEKAENRLFHLVLNILQVKQADE